MPTQFMRLTPASDRVMLMSGDGRTMRLEAAVGGFSLLQGLPPFLGGDGAPLDVEAAAGCSWADMPRFVGQMEFPFPMDPFREGGMAMTIVLHFPAINAGYGLVLFRGGIGAVEDGNSGPNADPSTGFVAARAIQMHR